jgi:hypothetical protein
MTLEHSSEGFIGAQSRRDRVASLVTHDTGDVHELQAGLAGERFERLCERLRGDVGGERRRLRTLGERCWTIKERDGRADRERAENPRHHGRDTR